MTEQPKIPYRFFHVTEPVEFYLDENDELVMEVDGEVTTSCETFHRGDPCIVCGATGKEWTGRVTQAWTSEEAVEHGLMSSTVQDEVRKLRQSIDGIMTLAPSTFREPPDPLASTCILLLNRIIGVLELLAMHQDTPGRNAAPHASQ